MTRSQRRWHTRLWVVLGPLIVVGFLTALSAWPPLANQPQLPSIASPANSDEPAVNPPTEEGRP